MSIPSCKPWALLGKVSEMTVFSSITPISDFPEVYADLLETLRHHEGPEVVTEVNRRTGAEIKALAGGTAFKLDLSTDSVPVPGWRRFHIKSVAAEVAWFFQGTRDVTWLRKYAPFWDKFVEDDGTTVDAAYGYRWRHQFGRDQLLQSLDALEANSSDRRVFISNWDPGYDGLGATDQKNVPCPLGFTLSVLGGRLHSSLFIRSSDVFVGLPYDVAGHAIVLDTIAASLPNVVGLGTMTVTLAHPHLYEHHYGLVDEMFVVQDCVTDRPPFQNCPIADLLEDPDGFVQAYVDGMQGLGQSDFNPRPEVVV